MKEINLKILSKISPFHKWKIPISMKRTTKKAKSLFPFKDENIYPACKIYHGLCSCKEKYIGD